MTASLPGGEPSPGTVRVAFVLPGVGVVARGAEVFVTALAGALAKRPGFEATLFCRGATSLPHHRLRALPRDTPWVQRLYAATRLGRKVLDTLFLDPLSLEWYTAALSAFPALWRGRYDVVVMEGGLVGAWLARLLRRLRGSAFVDVAHGVDPKWEGAFARQRPDRVVVFTEAAAAEIRRLAPRARVAVLPHGIDLERFHPGVAPARLELPRPVVLSVGAADSHKRLHLAVAAVAAMMPSPGGGPSLVILGDGPEAEAVDRLGAERLGAGRYRRRSVTREELPGFYAAADVFTLPSRTESFGLVYVEALACGTPVVAPEDAVRREVVGEAGVLCSVEDAAAYGRALDEAVSRHWGEGPRRRAERFGFGATADAWADLLRELATRPLHTPVLMLHHVEPEPLSPPARHPNSYLSPADLGRLLDLLARRGFHTLTLAQAARAWRGGRRPPRRSVVLTFDDGCRCFAEHALPALAERAMTATVFAVSGRLGATNRWDSEPGAGGEPAERREELMTAEELSEMAAAGVEIGCHGRRHRRLVGCSAEELDEEIARSKEELEAALGRPVETFCYPYGHSDEAARRAVEAAGYLAAAAIEDHPGAAPGDPFAVPRLVVNPGESTFELHLKASGWYRWWKKLPRLGLLRALGGRRAARR